MPPVEREREPTEGRKQQNELKVEKLQDIPVLVQDCVEAVAGPKSFSWLEVLTFNYNALYLMSNYPK